MQLTSKYLFVGAFVVLATLGSFAVWSILESNSQHEKSNDNSFVDSLAMSDAQEWLSSGRIKLVATCCCAPSVTVEVPLLESLDEKACVEKHLSNIYCNKDLPNDVRLDDHSAYRDGGEDPRETLRYAVVFNNQMLNHMAETDFGGCFSR